MKRKWSLENIQIRICPNVTPEVFSPKFMNKRSNIIGKDLGVVKVNDEISVLLADIMKDQMESDVEMDGEVWKSFKVIFFLGVQGKEYIQDIRKRIPFCFNSFAFISSNISLNDSQLGKCSKNDECVTLASYFKVFDPLGGGIYPLDYVIIIDQENYILRKIPIKINKYSNFVLDHGVTIENLYSIVDKYLKS